MLFLNLRKRWATFRGCTWEEVKDNKDKIIWLKETPKAESNFLRDYLFPAHTVIPSVDGRPASGLTRFWAFFRRKDFSPITRETGQGIELIGFKEIKPSRHQQIDNFEQSSDWFAVGANAGISLSLRIIIFMGMILGEEALSGMALTYTLPLMLLQQFIRIVFNTNELINARNRNLNKWAKTLANWSLFLLATVGIVFLFATDIIYVSTIISLLPAIAFVVNSVRFLQNFTYGIYNAFMWATATNVRDRDRYRVQCLKRFIQATGAGGLAILSGLVFFGVVAFSPVTKPIFLAVGLVDACASFFTTFREFGSTRETFSFRSIVKRLGGKVPQDEIDALNNEHILDKVNRYGESVFLVAKKPSINKMEQKKLYIYTGDDGKLKCCVKGKNEITLSVDSSLFPPASEKSVEINETALLEAVFNEAVRQHLIPPEEKFWHLGSMIQELNAINAIDDKNDSTRLTQLPEGMSSQDAKHLTATLLIDKNLVSKISELTHEMETLQNQPKSAWLPEWPWYSKHFGIERQISVLQTKIDFLECLKQLITGNTANADSNSNNEAALLLSGNNNAFSQIKSISDLELLFAQNPQLEADTFSAFYRKISNAEALFRVAERYFVLYKKPPENYDQDIQKLENSAAIFNSNATTTDNGDALSIKTSRTTSLNSDSDQDFLKTPDNTSGKNQQSHSPAPTIRKSVSQMVLKSKHSSPNLFACITNNNSGGEPQTTQSQQQQTHLGSPPGFRVTE